MEEARRNNADYRNRTSSENENVLTQTPLDFHAMNYLRVRNVIIPPHNYTVEPPRKRVPESSLTKNQIS
jgi:hypothetical protein